MTPNNCQDGQYERICRPEFLSLHSKLDRLDDAIRGNGKPGINLRLELLEAAAASRRRLTWIVIGAFVSAGASAVMQLVQFIGRQ
ncbi:MAG: hypothetical protein FWD61_00340 [Phycisphaerales bacterium]|nr:hypothetical protein [Phycisphaerales bacterium]